MSIEVTCRKCGEEFDSRHEKCPACGDDGSNGPVSVSHHTTETLEDKLKELSARIAADPLRFQQIRDELARRHATGNDQPTPETSEQRAEKLARYELNLQNNLVVKITAMEAEQAKLVIEAEIAKAQRDEAERRLALLVKTGTLLERPAFPTSLLDKSDPLSGDPARWIEKSAPNTTPHLDSVRVMLDKYAGPEQARTPMTRDDAKALAIEHKYKKGTAVGSVDEWVVDAIVEASK